MSSVRRWPSERKCPVCSSPASDLLLSVQDHHSLDLFDVHTCGECGCLYLKNPPPPERISPYYDNEMGRGMHVEPGVLFTRMRQVRILRDLRPFLAVMKPGAVTLDWGSGDGAVARALDRQGMVVGAADLFPAENWRIDHIPYRQYRPRATYDAADFEVGDVAATGVILRHVLEHVHEPVELLAAARRSGVKAALILVPNASSRLRKRLGRRWIHWDPPRHMNYFTPESLHACLERAGFRVAHLVTYGIDELVSSLHVAASIRSKSDDPHSHRWRFVAERTEPKGLLAGMSSAVSTPFTRTVCHAVAVAND